MMSMPAPASEDPRPKLGGFLETKISLGGFFEIALWTAGIGTLLTFLGQLHWMLENFACFRPQYFWLLLAGAIWAILVKRRWLAIGMAVMSMINVGSCIPWNPFHKPPANPTEPLRILHANVLATNNRYDLLYDLVAKEKPDIIFLAEVDLDWAHELDDLKKDYPINHGEPRGGAMGMAAFSKIPLDRLTIEHLSPVNVPSVHVQFERWGKTITMLYTHPYPPVNGGAQLARDQELTEITAAAIAAGGPRVILGDLNCTPESAIFQHIITKALVRDTRRGFGLQPTWPSDLPPLMIPIDHVLVSYEFEVLDRRLGPNIGSDHLPVIIDLGYRGAE